MLRPLLTLLVTLLTLLIAGCGDDHSGASIPQFSEMVFLSNRTATPPTSIFKANLNGSSVTPVPFANTDEYYPSISADGTKVAFYSQGNAWVENADGSGQLQLSTDGNANFVRIAPNGKQLVYNDSTANHILMVNVDGSALTDLTPTLPTGMTDCYSAGFSDDSALIVFVCSSSSNYGLYTIHSDGTGLATVTNSRTIWTDTPAFAPSGKAIIFVGKDSASVDDIETINLDGSGNAQLIANSDEVTILNSTLYYTVFSSTLELNQVYKAKLDGSDPTSVSDGTEDDYLGLAQ